MVHVIAIGLLPTGVEAVAVDVQLAVPVTPEVPKFSPFTNPLIVDVNDGFAAPYARLWLSPVTVRCAFVIVS